MQTQCPSARNRGFMAIAKLNQETARGHVFNRLLNNMKENQNRTKYLFIKPWKDPDVPTSVTTDHKKLTVFHSAHWEVSVQVCPTQIVRVSQRTPKLYYRLLSLLLISCHKRKLKNTCRSLYTWIIGHGETKSVLSVTYQNRKHSPCWLLITISEITGSLLGGKGRLQSYSAVNSVS